QSIDLELGKADVVELGPAELRRQPAGRKVWGSAPVRLVALVFGPRVEDARMREALALAVNRAAIHNVLLQRQGEVSAALLPQWLSGYAFLFPVAADAAKARTLVAGIPAAARAISLGVEDAAARPIAERIALNARDAGLAVSVVPQAARAAASQFSGGALRGGARAARRLPCYPAVRSSGSLRGESAREGQSGHHASG